MTLRNPITFIRYVRASSALIRATRFHDESAIADALHRIRATDPSDPLGLLILASHRDQTGSREAAFHLREEVLKIDPKNVLALQGIAEYWAHKGSVELACEAMRRVLQIDAATPKSSERALNFVLRVLRLFFRLIGRPGGEQRLRNGLRAARRHDRRWQEWAASYLAVHEEASRSTTPIN